MTVKTTTRRVRPLDVIGNLAVAGVGVAALGLFALPAVQQMQDGMVNAVDAGGPTSAAMVFAIAAPILASLAETPLGRMIGVTAATLMAFAARIWVEFVAGGDVLSALFLTVFCAVAVIALAAVKRHRNHAAAARVEALARLVSTAARQLAQRLTVAAGTSMEAVQPGGARAQVDLVHHLVVGVIAQAATEATPRRFAETLMIGLAEVVEGLSGNSRVDPSGHALRAAHRYTAALGVLVARETGRAATAALPAGVGMAAATP